ncbi:hypothetical protein J6K27_003459 [Rhodococcus qingshengii]|uniref:LtfC-like domain-containing protein n=1 Tax=Rhodococcus qingshengii TaxID=334542 RepID=UPI001AEFE6CD|nr:hypothetical protein [Rhodococcus qingshengii]QTR98339.1 hypothetical protein J6K27_003459 [Rhodococcus qingshengii]
MADIRKPTPKGALNLPTVGDFVYWYAFEDGIEFPNGTQMYFLLGDLEDTQLKWDFAITGDTASIKIESEVVATVDTGTKYWLMLKDTTTTPTTETELQTGTVKKVNA